MKLIISLFLFSTVLYLEAMDLPKLSNQQKENFLTEASSFLRDTHMMVLQNKIYPNNSIHCALVTLNSCLLQYDNDIVKVIEAMGLSDYIENYAKAVRSDDFVISCIKKLPYQRESIEFKKLYLKRAIYISAEVELQKKYPAFKPYIKWDNSNVEDKCDFVKKNHAFPSNLQEQKEFFAMFIYQRLYPYVN